MLDIYEHTMGGNPVCKGKSGHCYQVEGEWILGRQKQAPVHEKDLPEDVGELELGLWYYDSS